MEKCRDVCDKCRIFNQIHHMGQAVKFRHAGRARKKTTGTKSIKRVPAEKTVHASMEGKDTLALIELVREGIPYAEFEKIRALAAFPLSDWARFLQVSERTIQRNEKENKPFQPAQSERILEISMLYRYGMDVFGDKLNFDIWLGLKSIALGGKAPRELLDTRMGIGMVRDELGRIEHGVLA